MKKRKNPGEIFMDFLNRFGLKMRTKLIIIFLIVKVVPLLILMVLAMREFITLGNELREIALRDSTNALTNSAIENIERMTTDTATRVADFLYARDKDIIYIANIEPSEENYRRFLDNQTGRLIKKAEWMISPDGYLWVQANEPELEMVGGVSTNDENVKLREDDNTNFWSYRMPEVFEYIDVDLYDEIAFIDLDGNEVVKVVSSNSTKVNYPMNPEKRDISKKENTYVKAETYFEELKKLKPGDIYVSDVIGAYVGANYIGMYTPSVLQNNVAETHPNFNMLNEIGKLPLNDFIKEAEKQAFAGAENPNGQRFEGIVRWATPVTDDSGINIIGYVTFALNHDHIMEFVDHLTPMNERYTELSSAYEGNYAFIWDYKCRSICHPRHNSIVGFNPDTGEPEIPWLETSIYEAWQESNIEKWTDFVRDYPVFLEQSRTKKPAPALTQKGLVALDGRYLNNAPQCTGWMDLTKDGGSGSFYILWSGLQKLTTAAAIPYYTGHYAPSEANDYSLRGFGIVTIGAGLDDFNQPSVDMEILLMNTTEVNLVFTFVQLALTVLIIVCLVVFIAISLASFISNNINHLIDGLAHFQSGERQFRFDSTKNDEFGTLADSFDDMADSLADSVKSPLSIIDMDRKVIYMNEPGLKFINKTLPEIVGKLYGENSVYPVDSIYCPMKAFFENREAEAYYYQNYYLKGTANYLLDKFGNKIGYIITTTDVTEIVLEQMKTDRQWAMLNTMFSVSPDVIWYQDSKGSYLVVNPRFCGIAGKDESELIGKTAKEVLPADIAEIFIANDRAAVSASLPLYTEEKIMFADNHTEILESVRTPIYDANQKLVGLLGFMRDVTSRVTIENELRQTQIELEQAVVDANRANEHKGEFLARMSHEIRTPMNAIIGITNVVLKKLNDFDIGDKDSDLLEIKVYINQVENSSHHLLGILNDILDISKIEAGKIELSSEEVDMLKLSKTITDIIQIRCDEKNIIFKTIFEFNTHSMFVSDPLHLRQVLLNLLGNAVKFTSENGLIEFRIKEKERRNDMVLLEFSVSDTGIGIAKESQTKIFQPFEQENRQTTRKYGGTGLGLAISKRIIELLGGDIKVQSKLGEGSTFSFSVWMQEIQSQIDEEPEVVDITGKFKGKRLLVVDDIEINRMIIVSMLEETGLEIDEAEDGLIALKKFEESAENTYDIIFMDVQMPNMDGYEAVTAIRNLERQDAHKVPIIALTANAFKDDIDKAINCGMNLHIAKPVEMDNITEVLLKFLGSK